jgi:hypothetical protein
MGWNIVRGLVFIEDLEFLIDLEGENMWNVAAAFLREGGDGGRSGVIGSAGRDVDDDIFNSVAWSGDNGLVSWRSRVHLGTHGFFGHIDGLHFCGSAVISDSAGDGATAGRPGRATAEAAKMVKPARTTCFVRIRVFPPETKTSCGCCGHHEDFIEI